MSFVRELSIGSKNNYTSEQKKKTAEEIIKKRKEHSRLVKGIFNNVEAPGADLTFAFCEFKGEPVRVYHLEDGLEYEIPLGVARHINRQCKYKKSKHLIDPKTGRKITGADKPIDRYQFISNDFM